MGADHPDLHRGTFLPDLLIAALNRHPDRPAVYLGDNVLTGAEVRDVAADDVAGLAYTGGTTGKPKGVMGTYRSGAAMTEIQLAEWEWPEEVRFLIATPLSHAGAAFFIPTLLRGGSIVVLPGFD